MARINGGPVCFTITIVGLLSDQDEDEWQAGAQQLMAGVERELRAAFPTIALGHPPVTITAVDLPKPEDTTHGAN